MRWLSVRAQESPAMELDPPGAVKRARGAAPICEQNLKRSRAASPRHGVVLSTRSTGEFPESDNAMHRSSNMRRILSVLGGLDELEEEAAAEMLLDVVSPRC